MFSPFRQSRSPVAALPDHRCQVREEIKPRLRASSRSANPPCVRLPGRPRLAAAAHARFKLNNNRNLNKVLDGTARAHHCRRQAIDRVKSTAPTWYDYATAAAITEFYGVGNLCYLTCRKPVASLLSRTQCPRRLRRTATRAAACGRRAASRPTQSAAACTSGPRGWWSRSQLAARARGERGDRIVPAGNRGPRLPIGELKRTISKSVPGARRTGTDRYTRSTAVTRRADAGRWRAAMQQNNSGGRES